MRARGIYTLIRILSLDVVAGALATGAMVTRIMKVSMPWSWWIVLPMSVWVMYTTDHLMDAYRLKEQAHTPRHLFHHQYFTLLAVIAAVSLLLCIGVMPWFLPVELVVMGVVVGLAAMAHLGLVSWLKDRVAWFLHKELGVAGDLRPWDLGRTCVAFRTGHKLGAWIAIWAIPDIGPDQFVGFFPDRIPTGRNGWPYFSCQGPGYCIYLQTDPWRCFLADRGRNCTPDPHPAC